MLLTTTLVDVHRFKDFCIKQATNRYFIGCNISKNTFFSWFWIRFSAQARFTSEPCHRTCLTSKQKQGTDVMQLWKCLEQVSFLLPRSSSGFCADIKLDLRKHERNCDLTHTFPYRNQCLRRLSAALRTWAPPTCPQVSSTLSLLPPWCNFLQLSPSLHSGWHWQTVCFRARAVRPVSGASPASPAGWRLWTGSARCGAAVRPSAQTDNAKEQAPGEWCARFY